MKKLKIDKNPDIYNKNIEDIEIASSTKEAMLIFGSNINILRSVPLIFDGLKPVERRILYTMYSVNKCLHNKSFVKLANITGNVMGIFHPHGDTAINETAVRMAQPWNNIVCLIDRQGNFGSPDGEEAGSARYIEARLTYYAYKCFFEEFDIDALDTTMNYLNSEPEPLFLPAKYPNVLINSTFGIGYGESTSIPTFNFNEVLDMTIRVINKEVGPKDCWLYPDIASGAIILDEGQFKELCTTGSGKYKTRAVIDFDYDNHTLIIKKLPMLVKMNSIMDIITKDFEKGKIPGLVEIKDYSLDDEIHRELRFKPEVDLMDAYYNLMKRTRLEIGTSAKFNLIEDFKLGMYNLYDIITKWIDFRIMVKSRLLTMKLAKTYERLHILEVLLYILNDANISKTVNIIKSAKNKDEIISKLCKEYKITTLKADAIANLKMSAFSEDSVKAYTKEYEDKIKEKDKLNKSLKRKNIIKIIIEELEEGKKLFGEPRRSKIIKYDGGKKPISNTDHIVIVTKNGYIKKLPYKTNCEKTLGYLEQGDYPVDIIIGNNKSKLLLFDSRGKKHELFLHEIPNSVLSSKGTNLNELITVYGNIVKICLVKDDTSDKRFFIASSKNGLIKKGILNEIMAIKGSCTFMKVNDDDKLTDVLFIDDDKHDVLVYSKKGLGIRFRLDSIPCTGRNTKGVKIMQMDVDDSIIGFDDINDDAKELVIITEKGYVKKSSLDTLDTSKRNTDPVILLTLKDQDRIAKALAISDDRVIKIYKTSGIDIINTIDISISTRLAGAKKLIPVKLGDTIIDVV